MDLIENDPLSSLMWVCAALAVGGLVWVSLALARRQLARDGRRLLAFGTIGYLVTAVVSVVVRVSAADREAATVDDAVDEGSGASVDSRQSVGAKAEADAKAEAAATAAAEPAIDPAISGPPQRTGPEALRFAGLVAKDERCRDARAVAGAVRDLAAAAASEPRAKVDKAIDRLENCRKKIVWVKAATVRRQRMDAREAWLESLKTRMKNEGTPVFVTVRGAAGERIRLGGNKPTVTKLRAEFDGTLRKQLEDLGFTEVIFADMNDSETFALDVPKDHELAARELASYKLDKPITVE